MSPEREAHSEETLQDPTIVEGSYPCSDGSEVSSAILNAITDKGT